MPQIPDGSVIITPSQMYEEIRATRDAVQSLVGKFESVPATLKDHESRLAALEREAVTQADMDARFKKLVAVLTLVLTGLGTAATVIGVLIARGRLLTWCAGTGAAVPTGAPGAGVRAHRRGPALGFSVTADVGTFGVWRHDVARPWQLP